MLLHRRTSTLFQEALGGLVALCRAVRQSRGSGREAGWAGVPGAEWEGKWEFVVVEKGRTDLRVSGALTVVSF